MPSRRLVPARRLLRPDCRAGQVPGHLPQGRRPLHADDLRHALRQVRQTLPPQPRPVVGQVCPHLPHAPRR
jgi:hypothetical protein